MIRSVLYISRLFLSPSFWSPFPSINFKRSVQGIAKVWAFRNALTIQANLGNKKLRPRPLGNFYEFGTFKGNSLILMGMLKRIYRIFYPELSNFKLFSFDSFEGLPDSADEHKGPVWVKGAFCGTLNEVKKNMSSYSLRAKYIKGFYDKSLTQNLYSDLSNNPPSIIHIDVDLYTSTITVLKWLDKIALPMSIYIFDDVWAIGAHPNLGETKAINEYNSMDDMRGFLVEHPISLGSQTIYSFTLKDFSKDPIYTRNNEL
mgnify:CR=1 FL=1